MDVNNSFENKDEEIENKDIFKEFVSNKLSKEDEVFLKYLFTLQSGTLIALGKIPNPINDKMGRNMEQARELISILNMLKKKTDGNRSNVEEKVINNIIGNLQMSYVNEMIERDAEKDDSD